MVGPPRPPPVAGFFPPLEEELIADEVGGSGSRLGGRVWLALRACVLGESNSSALGGSIEAWGLEYTGPRLRRHHARVAAAGEESDGDGDVVVGAMRRCPYR
jgi:hypothetical protein